MLTPIDEFITRWQVSGGAERANYVLFLTELCRLLDLPEPDPAKAETAENSYVFERVVSHASADGSKTQRFIDLYRRGCFVLEAKQGTEQAADQAALLSTAARAAAKGRKKGTAVRGTTGWDTAMIRAKGQAESYVRDLPAAEGRPPFIVVVDVGHTIELYSEFSRTGGTYQPFPDSGSWRIRLEDLRRPEIRERLRAVWLDPLSLDPARRTARVTREIAGRLARLAQSLEKDGRDPHAVASFLMRCLFTMFAEDVGLLPRESFTELLRARRDRLPTFVPALEALWQTMDTGGFSPTLDRQILRFNGGLFADSAALPVTRDQLELLIEAAEADWRDVEPAIFGTLLERALDPVERHKLGAHYTPRAYVERLVLPTVIEPLREEWQSVQAAAVALANRGDGEEAVKEVQAFHRRLCDVRVLDPACGTGNFLYVTLEHLKRLEGEVLALLEDLGERQAVLEIEGKTVDPHNLLGIEVNPRAAAIAELVLWIGHLQWHFRNRGEVMPPEPVIRDHHNIECRDAVLAWDAVEDLLDDAGNPVTRWDGRTFKQHPVTGEMVPDETARVALKKYINPRPAQWPEAEFVVGNPPFIGNARMRELLGDGYATAIRDAFGHLNRSCDFVMYWWDRAAALVRKGKLQAFGLITTNSIRQPFNRKVIEYHMNTESNPLYLALAIPDHPWFSAEDGAAVRVAMTLGRRGACDGTVFRIASERRDAPTHFELESQTGPIGPNLQLGVDFSQTVGLGSNAGLCSMGVKLHGSGFLLDSNDRDELLSQSDLAKEVIKHYVNGKDLAGSPRGLFVIDLFGHEIKQVADRYPAIFQRVHDAVKPERDANRRATYREKWWIFGEPRATFRPAFLGLTRYVATCRTAKHRIFSFLDTDVLAESKVVMIAVDDALLLGVLSSAIHASWALATGGFLGVGNDSNYNHSDCFNKFPFPDPSPELKQRIRDLGERLDAHRKRQQALHPKLTLTNMYNALEAVRAGRALTPKEKESYEQGLVGVLKEIHDELDAAVAEAYGWPADLADEEILERLVALNKERAEEERRGIVRWLRPEYQAPDSAAAAAARDEQPDMIGEQEQAPTPPPPPAPKQKAPWPKKLPEQVQAVRRELAAVGTGIDVDGLAGRFKGARKDRLEEVLATLAALGQARAGEAGFYAQG